MPAMMKINLILKALVASFVVALSLGSFSAFAIPASEDLEVINYQNHLNKNFSGLNVTVKDGNAWSVEVIKDLESLENYLQGDTREVGPLIRIACDKCVCSGCYSK